MDGCTPHFKCALELPNSLMSHVVGHQGQGLKQALDISSACLAAFMVGSANRDCWYITIQGTNQQISEALMVIRKWIARKQVHILWKQCSGNIVPAPLGNTALSTPTPTVSCTHSSPSVFPSEDIDCYPCYLACSVPPSRLADVECSHGGHTSFCDGHDFTNDPLYTGAWCQISYYKLSNGVGNCSCSLSCCMW